MPKIIDAGWSSLVARRAHNPKVACSNHAPATTKPRTSSRESAVFAFLMQHEGRMRESVGRSSGSEDDERTRRAGERTGADTPEPMSGRDAGLAARVPADIELHGRRLRVLGVDTIVAIKRASNHQMDRLALAVLEATLNRREQRDPQGGRRGFWRMWGWILKRVGIEQRAVSAHRPSRHPPDEGVDMALANPGLIGFPAGAAAA